MISDGLRLLVAPVVLAILAAPVVTTTTDLLAFGDNQKASEARRASQALIVDDEDKLFHQVDHSGIEVASAKQSENPDKGLTDEERMARIQGLRSANTRRAQAFIDSGADPRLLERISVSGYAAPEPSLEGSVDKADLIVLAWVTSVDYFIENGMTYSSAHVTVHETLKGDAAQSSFVVRQVGGPVGDGQGVKLFYLKESELLLRGDRAVLMLRSFHGKYLPLLGSGVTFLRDGYAVPEASSRFGAELSGKSLQDLLALIRAQL